MQLKIAATRAVALTGTLPCVSLRSGGDSRRGRSNPAPIASIHPALHADDKEEEGQSVSLVKSELGDPPPILVQGF